MKPSGVQGQGRAPPAAARPRGRPAEYSISYVRYIMSVLRITTPLISSHSGVHICIMVGCSIDDSHRAGPWTGGRQLCRCRRGVRPFHRGRGCAPERSLKNMLAALPSSTERQALFSLFAAQTSAAGSPHGATDVARERVGALLVPHSSSRMPAPSPVLPMPLTLNASDVCSRTARRWWPAAFLTTSKAACEPFNPVWLFCIASAFCA